MFKTACILNIMRILKRVNPGDMYYEAYLGHYGRHKKDFYDLYHKIWEIGSATPPRRILEIGTRTGISLCQLLSSYIDLSVIERIVCIDPFLDDFLSPHLVQANLKYLNLPWDKVEFVIERSQDALPALVREGNEFDYILVDGDHAKAAARSDLEMADQLIAKGGIILFDDISTAPGECALIDVWEDFMRVHDEKYQAFFNMTGKGVAWAVRR